VQGTSSPASAGLFLYRRRSTQQIASY
jgi:hypothetical protein